MTKNITINHGKFKLQDDIEEISEGEVKKIGNGGMIMSSKKYIGIVSECNNRIVLF